MCGCKICISTKRMNSSLLGWRNFHLKHLKDTSQNEQNKRSGELSRRIFETYKNAVRPYVYHIYNSSAEMAMGKNCLCPSQHYGLPNWKCVLLCCEKCPSISIHHQDTSTDAKNMCSTIRFHVYRNVSHFNVYGILSYEE